MKYVRIFFAVTLIFSLCSAFSLKTKEKNKDKAVYAFGVAVSFNDTVVYYTAIQKLDSVELKKGFLPKREQYTRQLKEYLRDELKSPDYTCMIYFSESKSQLEKEESKLKSKYKQRKSFSLVPIAFEAFAFKYPSSDE